MNKTTKQLLEENNQREKELSPDNQKVLTDIVAYLRGSSTLFCNRSRCAGYYRDASGGRDPWSECPDHHRDKLSGLLR